MIFVTVGSEKFPFDRLIRILDNAVKAGRIKEDVFAQIGNSAYVPSSFEYCDFLAFRDIIAFINKSDMVITHAGVGSILLCLSLGKHPVIFPRLSAFGEHLDDHQLELSKNLENTGKVLVAYDEKGLLSKIEGYMLGGIVDRYELRADPIKSGWCLVNYLQKIIEGTT